VRSLAWHGIRARTNGPEDRVSPVWVETHPFEGLMKGHHPNSFFAPIWCSWAHHLSLSLSLSLTLSLYLSLYLSHCALFSFHFTITHTQHTFFSSSKTVFDLSNSTMLCLTSTEKPSSSLSFSLVVRRCLFVCVYIYLAKVRPKGSLSYLAFCFNLRTELGFLLSHKAVKKGGSEGERYFFFFSF